MKKLLTILMVLGMSGMTFGQNGIDTKSVKIRNLAGSGQITLAVDNSGNIIQDMTRIAKVDSSDTYYTPYYINTNFATKTDLAAIDVGLIIKDSVSVATTANLDLSGAETIDGIGSFVGMRVLVKNQTDSIQNGVYVVAAGSWTRTTDLNTWAKLYHSYVVVSRGLTQGGASYACGIGNAGTVGVNKIWFNLFNAPSSIVAGAGLDKTGNQIYVLVDNSTIETSSDILRIKDAGVVNAKVATGIDAVKIGNGSVTNSEFQTLSDIHINKTIQGQIDSLKLINNTFSGEYIDSLGFEYFGTKLNFASFRNSSKIHTFSIPGATTSYCGVMTTENVAKLNTIEFGAEQNVHADWNAASSSLDSWIANKPTYFAANALVKDSSKFNISGTLVNKNITAKAGIYQLTIDAANDTNQIKIGSSTSPTDFYLRNNQGFCEVLNSNRSGLRIYSFDGSVGVIKNGSLLYALPTAGGGYGYSLTSTGAGNVATWTNVTGGGGGGKGTVTSVGLSLPTELTVSGSPVTTAGTLTALWANQTGNLVFASPSGTTGTPSFRALTDNDIPNTITASNYLLLSGGTLTNKLTIPENNSSIAMFRLTQGTPNPSTLSNGDMWCNPSGFFGRVNNTTVALGTAGAGGVTTFTSSPATGLFNSGNAANPFIKAGFDSLTTVVSSLSDYIAIADASSSSTGTSPKTLYKFTLDSLKNRIGTTFNLTVKDIDGTPTKTNVSKIVFDGATVVDSATGIVKVVITPSTGTGDEPFQVLAETGSINWSWLTSKNAKIADVDGNITLSFSSRTDGQEGYLEIKTDPTTDYTLTFPVGCWFANARTTRVFNLEHGNKYVFYLKYTGTDTNIDYAVYGQVN